MKSKKWKYIINVSCILIAIIFTILVKVVDVKNVGVNSTNIGFSTINQFIFRTVGVNMTWYHITEILGLVLIFIAMIYALIGIIQLIKKKKYIEGR